MFTIVCVHSASERRSPSTWDLRSPEPPGRTAHEGGRPDGHHEPMGPVPGPAQRAGRAGPDEPDAGPRARPARPAAGQRSGLEDGLLTIQGERHFAHDSSEQQFHRVERRYGAFRRSITLPAHVMAEGIQATTDNGVLQILVPKAEEATPKRIQVRPGRAEVPAASGEDTPPS